MVNPSVYSSLFYKFNKALYSFLCKAHPFHAKSRYLILHHIFNTFAKIFLILVILLRSHLKNPSFQLFTLGFLGRQSYLHQVTIITFLHLNIYFIFYCLVLAKTSVTTLKNSNNVVYFSQL